MVSAKQVNGAMRGLLAEGASVREATDLIEKIPGWMKSWDYDVDDDNNVTIIELTED